MMPSSRTDPADRTIELTMGDAPAVMVDAEAGVRGDL
jgi:hypothetical protein